MKVFDLVTEVPPYPDPLGISTEIDLRVAQQLFASGTFVRTYVFFLLLRSCMGTYVLSFSKLDLIKQCPGIDS